MTDAIFTEISDNIKGDASLLKSVNGVYQFNVNAGGQTKTYTVDLKNAPGSVKSGPAQKADCTISIKEEDLLDLKSGKLNGQKAFMQGKLKIQGNMSYAMKLNQLFQKKTGGAATPAAATPAAAAPAKPAASSAPAVSAPAAVGDDKLSGVFAGLAAGVKANPDVVKKVNGVYQFNLNTPKGEVKWTVDLKNGGGSVSSGPAPKADCTITMKEADFLDLMSGKIDGQKAFMGGKLKIGGNMGLAMKLKELTNAVKPKAKL